MSIHKLPEYLINRLKAWEIVERPSSVLKELVENSLDAWADEIIININDWWKNLIWVEDNGTWIELSDMDMLFERYATSKINWEQDLYNLQSYWFRWEALASIAEVSKTTVISKTSYSEIWSKLTKTWQNIIINHLPVWFNHGTVIQIQDLFYNVPARLKFLKSSQTEFFYCYNYFIDVALYHYDKHFVLKKNDKIAFDLTRVDWILERILQIYKKDRSKNLKEVSYQDEWITLNWLVGNNQILFWSWENIKIYVNSRPVQDKIIKKALMDAYFRQITPWEYPFAVLLIDAKAWIVDVNVHPRKSEVKFINPQKIFQIIHDSVQKALWNNKIWNINFSQHFSNQTWSQNYWYNQNQQIWNQKNEENLFWESELNNIFATHNENFN
jgi:DNA mismatch repair protein MutL